MYLKFITEIIARFCEAFDQSYALKKYDIIIN